MNQVKQSFLNNEKGMTLIEVLASIVILTIILTSVLTIFLQSTKATQTSSNTIDATYIAQQEMERMYGLSRDIEFSNLENKLKDYEGPFFGENSEKYEKKIEDSTYKIIAKFEEKAGLVNILIIVQDTINPSKDLAQMENFLEWGLSDE